MAVKFLIFIGSWNVINARISPITKAYTAQVIRIVLKSDSGVTPVLNSNSKGSRSCDLCYRELTTAIQADSCSAIMAMFHQV
jgi:hypothetical protein